MPTDETTYIVLRNKPNDEGDCWVAYSITRSRDALSAVRKAADEKKLAEPAVLVAVSERHFQPVKVTPKQTTSLTIEPVDEAGK